MARRQILIACAGSLLLGLSPAAATAHTYVVVIDKLKFGPTPTGLRKGDTILWDNRDILRHSATAIDHSFDADLQPGRKVKTLLNARGSIAFVCRYHPGMRGMLEVK